MPAELRAGAAAPTPEELAAWQSSTRAADVLAAQGARPMDAAAAEEFYLRTFARAAVDVNGIRGGEATLQKTVLPVEAEANVSIRLAPGQDAEAIDGASSGCCALAARRAPSSRSSAGRPTARASSRPPPPRSGSRSTRSSARSACGRCSCEPAARSRSSRPSPESGIPVILTGFDVPEGNIHAPNERLLVRYVPLGVAAARETLVALLPAKRRLDD